MIYCQDVVFSPCLYLHIDCAIIVDCQPNAYLFICFVKVAQLQKDSGQLTTCAIHKLKAQLKQLPGLLYILCLIKTNCGAAYELVILRPDGDKSLLTIVINILQLESHLVVREAMSFS